MVFFPPTVRVPGQAWPTPVVLVPQNSTIEIDCTLTNSYWLIVLANDAHQTQRQFSERGGQTDLLNDRGVYELPQGLLVNDTSGNNGTEIDCLGENNEALTTSIFVYGKQMNK